MASNYDDVLSQLQAAGLLVDSLEIGRLRRCRTADGGREKRGWFLLHEIRLDNGNDLIVGSFGVWQGSENNARKVEISKNEISREQAEALRKRLAEDKRRSELERKAEAERAAARASAAWKKCDATGESTYLQRKGVAGYGVRYSPSGAMVIPLLDTSNNIHGLQIIRGKNRKPGTQEKEYWPVGLIKKGRFHLIGMPTAGGLLLLVEGYATGASLHAATGLPVAVAFDANNLVPVGEALRARYKGLRILACADDDNTQKCHAKNEAESVRQGKHVECKTRVWVADGPKCPHCGEDHKAGNAGVSMASTCAMQVGGSWLAPAFADPAAVREAWLSKGEKFNDFNDLHLAEGLHVVRDQIEVRLLELGWRSRNGANALPRTQGGGEAGVLAPLKPIDSLDELLERYALVYGQGGAVFDHDEHRLVTLTDMGHICLSRDLYRTWSEHPDRQIVRPEQVGFDPAGSDKGITCNLWDGWPTKPKAGNCEKLLELLWHMCSAESQKDDLFMWVLRWLAFPLQHPGAKMKSTIVMHGPQGTGKNMFFEAYMEIFGKYGWTIDQSAIEDKFNDWASRKLFLIADEVVARSDLYHIKNKLKAFITGDKIRINPKNMAAYYEANHVNMVFLSNEAMPVVLEEDDRRHAVIWTPEKLSAAFYKEVKAEIDAGGAAALYDFLLQLELGDFTNATNPPMTDAKRELIDLSLDSPSKFVKVFEAGDLPGFPAKGAPALLTPCLMSDMYELYKWWCASTNERALTLPRFSNSITRKHKGEVLRKRYRLDVHQVRGPVSVCYLPGGNELPAGYSEVDWLGERIDIFRRAVRDLKGGVA